MNKNNVISIIGLVLSIISLIFSFIPFINVFAFIFSSVSIIIAIFAIIKEQKRLIAMITLFISIASFTTSIFISKNFVFNKFKSIKELNLEGKTKLTEISKNNSLTSTYLQSVAKSLDEKVDIYMGELTTIKDKSGINNHKLPIFIKNKSDTDIRVRVGLEAYTTSGMRIASSYTNITDFIGPNEYIEIDSFTSTVNEKFESLKKAKFKISHIDIYYTRNEVIYYSF